MLAELVNHLWQSTLVAAAIALLARRFHGEGAHVRYWLWWAASAKFLLPFAALEALGRALAGATGGIFVSPQWSDAAVRLAEPLAAGAASAALTAGVALVWIAGTIAVLGRWLMGSLRIRRVLRDAAPHADLAITRAVALPVKSTSAPMEPAVVGLLKPVLILPEGIAARLSPEQLQAVLTHEQCHWRRRDNLTAAAHMVVEAVFWFYPLVWWIGARLIEERERACDETVVRAGHDRATYAESMLRVCELCVASPLSCAAGVSGADLKRRVTEIMRSAPMRKLSVVRKSLLAVALAAALLVPIAAGLVSGAPAFAQDLVPLVRIAPNYPDDALAAGLDGVVTLEFTIATSGTTKDIVVVESSDPSFEQSAIAALGKWRYQPQSASGQPVEVTGVRTVIRFKHDGGPQIQIRQP